MILHQVPLKERLLGTMIERLCQAMDTIDQQWSKQVEPAAEEQIHALPERKIIMKKDLGFLKCRIDSYIPGIMLKSKQNVIAEAIALFFCGSAFI